MARTRRPSLRVVPSPSETPRPRLSEVSSTLQDRLALGHLPTPSYRDEALLRFSDDYATTIAPKPPQPETTSHRRYMARIIGWGGALIAATALAATHPNNVASAVDSVRSSIGADPSQVAAHDAQFDQANQAQFLELHPPGVTNTPPTQ